MTLLRHPRAASLALALLLLAMALAQLRAGSASTPDPARELLSGLFGHGEQVAARLIVAVEFAAAAAVLVAGTRFLNLLIATALVFFSLACVSRAVTDGGLLFPALCLVGSIVLLAFARWSKPTAPRDGRRGLSPVWPALGAVAAATMAGHWTAAASFHVPGAPAAATPVAPPKQTVPSIDLDMRPFEGRPLSETTLARYLPKIVELCEGRDAYIVVYSPYCESCFTLFTSNFAVPRPERTIAITVPMSDDAVSATDEPPRPIECLDCEELSLPKGPTWIVAPPMVLKVEGGVVTCVADRFGGDCLPKD